jgi:hypothetical protein
MRSTDHSTKNPRRTLSSIARVLRLGIAPALLATAVACSGSNESTDDDDSEALVGGEWQSLWEKVSRTAHLYDGKWTNWYRHGRAVGIVKLGLMRMELEKKNLFSAYPKDEKGVVRTGYRDWTCGPETKHARTYDGSCNAPENPGEGAATTRFSRNIGFAQGNAVIDESLSKILGKDVNSATTDERNRAWNQYVMSPNPRDVSMKLLARRNEGGKPAFIPFESMNMIGASWIQFVIHDWYSHGDPTPDRVWSVPLGATDPLRAHVNTLELPGSSFDALHPEDAALGIRLATNNEVTHWFDGSQIYGSDVATGRAIRELRDGLLKVSSEGYLPTDAKGIELAGVNRNWWMGLGLVHTVFALEHNAIARMLKATYEVDPRTKQPWTDETLFQTARLINAAQIAKIHIRDFLVAMTDHPTLESAGIANYYGVLNHELRTKSGVAQKAKQVLDKVPFGGHELSSILFGILGNNPYKAGVPQAMTEEFAATYRMHPVLPEEIPILDAQTGAVNSVVPLRDMRASGVATMKRDIGTPNLLASFGTQASGALVLHNFPGFLQDIDVYLYKDHVQLFDHLDVGALEIIRDRERGIPRYNKLRELIGLKPFATFEEFASPEDARDLREVYASVDDVDLLTGLYAEKRHPSHPDEQDPDRATRRLLYTETSFSLFLNMSSRRLLTDRFFTSEYTPDTYTQAGLDWVDCAGSCGEGPAQHDAMKRILLRHFPSLASSGLRHVRNAFRRWAPGAEPADLEKGESIEPVAEKPADQNP